MPHLESLLLHPHCFPALALRLTSPAHVLFVPQGRDAEAASGFLDEIKLLNCLAGRSNIIQLIDSEVRFEQCRQRLNRWLLMGGKGTHVGRLSHQGGGLPRICGSGLGMALDQGHSSKAAVRFQAARQSVHRGIV